MYIRIDCDSCGRSWDLYKIDDPESETVRTCPHCGTRIDRDVWIEKVIPAIRATDDANRELFDRCPLFGVSCISNHVNLARN